MDLVGISLNVLLLLLLAAGLAYGMRLERRLKALREGHAVFAQAVRELDQSVLRAEAGLDQLRKAGEEARDGLHDRILKGREAISELERLIARAERVRAQPQVAIQAQPAPAPQTRLQERPQERPQERRSALRGEGEAERVVQAILSLGESDRAPVLRGPAQAFERVAEPRPARRPRTAVDDDLFEAPAPELRRAVGGGRR